MDEPLTVLPKGTIVRITDRNHEYYGYNGEYVAPGLRGCFVTPLVPGATLVTDDQFEVLESPPLTEGQLYDEMVELIRRFAQQKRAYLLGLSLDRYYRDGQEHSLCVSFTDGEKVKTVGTTAHDALLQMCEHLRKKLVA